MAGVADQATRAAVVCAGFGRMMNRKTAIIRRVADGRKRENRTRARASTYLGT